ncbi:MAG: glycosyltransferase family 9 protein [Pseudomonadota bacterium]|nr:glycosyltransferase family 9 protein [Pseudomonadota bacterium]
MRILFVTANRVGDAVLSTGILAYLAAKHPTAEFTIAAGPAAISLFRALPNLHRLIVMEKKRYGAHWLSLWRDCVASRWDIIVDLRRSALAYCLMAGQRFIIPKAKRDMHRVELLASTIGLDATPPAPTLWLENSTEDEAEGGQKIAIAPAANWIGKQWSSERFAELAARLSAPNGLFANARIAIFAAEAERDQVQALFDNLPKDSYDDLVGVGDLSDVAHLLSRCSFFVGNDSGLMHMSAALGVPTLGLFGPSRTEHYAPWGPKCGYVRTKESYEEIVGAPGYDHRTTGSLMGGLTVDAVESAARQLVERIGTSQ